VVEGLAVRFLAPQWLYAITLLPLIFVFFLLDERGREKRFAQFIGKALWGRLVPELDPRARRRKLFTWLGGMVFVFLALARPQWGTHEEVVHASGLDVMIALDISNSMNVEDVAPSRLLKAKHLVRTLAERLQGDRVGLVSFAGSGYLACPLTTDTEYLLEQLSIQTPRLLATQGTDIGIGLEAALKALDRASEEGEHHEQSTDPATSQASRVIILVTDGEDFEGHAAEAADQLKTEGVKLYIFGVGTQKGGPIPMRDEDSTLRGYKKDHDGQAVISTFKPDAMIQLASAAGGQYWNATTDEGEVTELLKDMGALHQGELAEHRYLTYEERFQYPLAIAIFLFLLELTLATRKKTAALVLLFCLGTILGSRDARAEAPVDAYLENQKGIDAYKKGQMEEARKRFGSAQALDPSAPELQYNQGLVQLDGGDPDAAAQDFKDAAQGAMKSGDTGLAGRSLFNLGSALTKKGDINGAIQSYLATIDAARKGKPDAKSAELESDARKNIELLIQQKQKQKQQPNQQQQQKQDQQQNQQQQQQQSQDQKQNSGGDQQKNQEKEKDKNQDQGQDQKQKDQQQPQNQQQQEQRYETGSGNRNFKSEKLSEEDAERVMAELKNKEQDLQVRQAIKKQNANRENDYKDW
jgi:Ca-activated chloride channel family protein